MSDFILQNVPGGGGGGGVAWSAITNALGNLSLSNGTNTSTFNQTAATVWTWANTTAAIKGTNQASPAFNLNGTYYTANSSATDKWAVAVLAPATETITTNTPGLSENAGSVVTMNYLGTTALIGETYCITGMTTFTWLNNQNVVILTASASGVTFNDPTAHGAQALHTDTGTGTLVNSPTRLTFTHSGTPEIAGTTSKASNHSFDIVGATVFPALRFSDGTNFLTLSLPNSNTLDLFSSVGGSLTINATGGLNIIGSGSAKITLAVGVGLTGSGTSVLHSFNSATAATSSQSVSTGIQLNGDYWTGAASATDTWQVQDVVSNGTNGASNLVISHPTGTTGLTNIQLNAHVGTTNTDFAGSVSSIGGATTTVSVVYSVAYTNTPLVVVTPTTLAGAFYLSASSNSGFTITYVTAGPQTFNYHVIGSTS